MFTAIVAVLGTLCRIAPDRRPPALKPAGRPPRRGRGRPPQRGPGRRRGLSCGARRPPLCNVGTREPAPARGGLVRGPSREPPHPFRRHSPAAARAAAHPRSTAASSKRRVGARRVNTCPVCGSPRPAILTNDQLREFCERPEVDHVSPGRDSQKSSQNLGVVRDSSDRLPGWI
jgi:hypothetical protein